MRRIPRPRDLVAKPPVLEAVDSTTQGVALVKRCATDTAHEVSAVPEQRFLVERREMFGKGVAGTAGAGRLEIVNQHRNIKRRMDVDEQVDMIGFAAKLQ